MRLVNLKPAIAIALSLELIISPVQAQVGGIQNPLAQGALTIGATLLGGGGAGFGGQPGGPSASAQQDVQKLRSELQPLPDTYFKPEVLFKIPGFAQFAAKQTSGIPLGCNTLPTTISQIKAEVCTIGYTADKGDINTQMLDMGLYEQQYSTIESTYNDFALESRNVANSPIGFSCMNNIMQLLRGFFDERLGAFDKISDDLKAMTNKLEALAKKDLENLAVAATLLDGGNSELSNGVRSKFPDAFDYGKRFKDPACTSMFAQDQFNQLGAGGLNNIDKELKQSLNEKPPGSKFSGASYAQNHNAVVGDLNKMIGSIADKVQGEFTSMSANDKGYADFVNGLSRKVSSANGSTGLLTGDLFTELQSKFNTETDRLRSQASTIATNLSSAGANPGTAIALARETNSKEFEAALRNIKKDIDARCWADQLKSIDLNTVFGKISRVGTSPRLNKSLKNFKTDLQRILTSNTTLDEKMKQLKELDEGRGSNYVLPLNMAATFSAEETGKTTELGTKKPTPALYFTTLITTCRAQYTKTLRNNSSSDAQSLADLKRLRADYRNLANNHANDIKSELTEKLVTCSATAGESTIGTCDASKFSVNKAPFCAQQALSCSQNMQKCNTMATNYVKEITAQRTNILNGFNQAVDDERVRIYNSVKLLQSELEKQAAEIAKAFPGASYTPPAGGIEAEVQGSGKFMSDYQSAFKLNVNDPKAVVALMTQNIKKLRDSVKAQQEKILSGGPTPPFSGILGQHATGAKQKYEKAAQVAADLAQKCAGQRANASGILAQQINDFNKQMGEQNQKTEAFCRKYSMAQTNPGPACKGNFEEVIDGALGAVKTAEAQEAANEYASVCAEFNNENGQNNSDDDTKSSSGSIADGKVNDICNEDLMKDDADCTTWKTIQAEKKDPKIGVKACFRGPTTTRYEKDNPVKEESDVCPKVKSDIVANYNYLKKKKGESGTLVVQGGLPSFCAAQNNAGRSMFDNFGLGGQQPPRGPASSASGQ